MDEAYHMTPPSGIYEEFVGRMATYYRARGKVVGTCYSYDASHCYEPSAIRKVLNGMIAEVNANTVARHGHIDLYLQDRVVSVISQGNTVTGVVTDHGMTFHSKVLIDATEFGDVLPLTPAAYRSGPSVGVDRNNSCTQDITYAMIIKKYPSGVPKKLQLLHPPPQYEQWLPMLKREFQVDGNPNNKTLPVSFAIHNEYRGLPDSSNPDPYVATENYQITKTGLNWFNDFPVRTSIYNRARRKKLLCDAKLKTLANLYYIQHEMKQPLWSVATDEGYDTAHNRTGNSCPDIPKEFKDIEANFPPSPYVRESQRIIGEYTLTGADIRRDGEGEKSVVGFRDAIAVGNYADDLHGCKAAGDFNNDIEHLSNLPPGFIMGPFEVPLRSLIPEKVDGLLAAEKNISQSRLANGATRLQPITMLTGQAAGTLAALAVAEGVQPRSVLPERVQIVLLQSGSILAREPMPDIPMGTRPWQAAQFVITHEWMKTDSKGFAPSKKLTRAEAAETLAYAFSLTTPPDKYDAPKYTIATYKDVPLYVEESAAVEALHAVGVALSCKQSPDLFCPDGFFTTDQFIQLVVALNARKSLNHVQDTAQLHRDVLGKDDDPITRGDAATMLYNSVENMLGSN